MLSNKRKEKISAFLDNDLHRDELMSFSLSGENDDAEVARRYQMVGDTLRGEMSESSFVDVSSAVREALVNEVTYSATPADNVSRSSTSQSVADHSVAEKSAAKGIFGLSGWLKPAAGFAVAASVAVVMVATVSEPETGVVAPIATNTLSQPAAQAAIQVAAQPTVRAADETIARQVSVDGAAQPQAVNVQFNQAGNQQLINPGSINQRLVNQHLKYATQDTLQGRMPIVRAVSFEADK